MVYPFPLSLSGSMPLESTAAAYFCDFNTAEKKERNLNLLCCFYPFGAPVYLWFQCSQGGGFVPGNLLMIEESRTFYDNCFSVLLVRDVSLNHPRPVYACTPTDSQSTVIN